MSVVHLDQHRPVDLLSKPEVKNLLANWYTHSIGGKKAYGPVLLTPLLEVTSGANDENDPLKNVRFRLPKLMFVIQPVVCAWSRNEKCDLDYIEKSATTFPSSVVKEYVNELVEMCAIIRAETQNGVTYYYPTRAIVYRVFEVISATVDAIDSLREDSGEGIDAINIVRPWVGINTPIPKQ